MWEHIRLLKSSIPFFDLDLFIRNGFLTNGA